MSLNIQGWGPMGYSPAPLFIFIANTCLCHILGTEGQYGKGLPNSRSFLRITIDFWSTKVISPGGKDSSGWRSVWHHTYAELPSLPRLQHRQALSSNLQEFPGPQLATLRSRHTHILIRTRIVNLAQCLELLDNFFFSQTTLSSKPFSLLQLQGIMVILIIIIPTDPWQSL